MNILILSWRGPKHPHEGGAEIVTHHYARAWVEAGHTVTLFTSIFAGVTPNETIDGVKIVRMGSAVGGVQFFFFFWYLFNSEKFDLVVDQFHGIPFFTPLYVRTKKLGFIHEVAKEVWALNPWPKPFNLIPKIIGEFFEPFLFKVLYRNVPFLTVSRSTKKELMEWQIKERNITIIHNGVDLVSPILEADKEKIPTITFFGAIAKDKGVEDALQAFALIFKQHPECHFWVIGKADANYISYLKNLSEDLGIAASTTFWGYVSQEQKFELLKRSHFILNPSSREGWGLVVIEAAAMGTPTIGYNVPGLRDSIMHNKSGILCAENTVENLSYNANILLADREKFEKLVKGAVEWSKTFRWEKAEKESLELIEQL